LHASFFCGGDIIGIATAVGGVGDNKVFERILDGLFRLPVNAGQPDQGFNRLLRPLLHDAAATDAAASALRGRPRGRLGRRIRERIHSSPSRL
jgi:hypothetical protein